MKTRSNNGNQDQFAGDLILMQEQLFFYALQLTEDREDALDLVQETSYKALKNRTRLHNEDHIRAWLYTILKNTYINYLRSSHFRQLVHDTEELNQYSPQNGNQSEPMPDEALMNKELHRQACHKSSAIMAAMRLSWPGRPGSQANCCAHPR